MDGYFPSEFEMDSNNFDVFMEHGFLPGRMIHPSKGTYRSLHPNNLVIFNANVIIESHGKIWYGDLDITKDRDELDKISLDLGEPLYILREMDARFENENLSIEEFKNRAVIKIG